MDDLLTAIRAKRAELDRLRPISAGALLQLQKYYDVELTYTSNAIEGNTLTLRETAEVIEHGITVGGKRLKDHLEAIDHYDAVLWMSEPEIAGIYSAHRRRIAGSAVVFPNPAKLPELMAAFGRSLEQATTPAAAFDAHFRLTAIHPFADGNGRTARLLMNLLLIRGGYVPIAVRPEDRKTYLETLERGSLADDLAPFQRFMHERLDATLGEYLTALQP
jgi:Fic family protein